MTDLNLPDRIADLLRNDPACVGRVTVRTINAIASECERTITEALATLSKPEPAAGKFLKSIKAEADRANEVIRLNRHREGQGMITVATALHRIAEWSTQAVTSPSSEAISPPDECKECGRRRPNDCRVCAAIEASSEPCPPDARAVVEAVTQDDREAAANVWRDYIARTGEIIVERNMRAGGLDDGLPAAFAAHRIAALFSIEEPRG